MASYIGLILLVAVWLVLVVFFRHYRIWLLYYCVASVGLALLLIFAGARLLPIERWLEMATTSGAHAYASLLGIQTRVFEATPGDILVWVVVQAPGWTIVRVDVECSGFLEMAVLVGLLLFYPSWSFLRRIGYIGVGLVALFGANLVRVVSILTILHTFGKPSIFVAHTIIGRIIFFILAIGVYWLLLSRLTLRSLAVDIRARMRA